jgi:hypothetical protein
MKKVKRIKAISTDWMKLSFEELGKIEVVPGVTLEQFYEEHVRKKAGEDFARKELLDWEAKGFRMLDERRGELVKTIPLDSTLAALKKIHSEKHEPLSVGWLASKAGMDRQRFIRNILPKLKRYDELRAEMFGTGTKGILAEYGI